MTQEIERRLAALETEAARLRDYFAVQQLIASYGPLVDTADGPDGAQRLAGLWSEGGVYAIGDVGEFAGHEQIAALFAQGHFDMVPQGVCHVMGLPHIRVDGDRAVAFNYTCVFRPRGEAFYPWRVSANRWDCVRAAGVWRIERRTNRPMTGDSNALAMLRGVTAPDAPS